MSNLDKKENINHLKKSTTLEKSIIISGTIKNISVENDKFTIETNNGIYYTNIIKGSINCSIESSEKKIIPLSQLDVGDLIKIKLKHNLINKIYVKTKYIILSESSEDYIS
jgi:hypothetical protein